MRRGGARLRARRAWLWTALALGAAARVFLVVASEGSYDTLIWQSHAGWTRQWGLSSYYERMPAFNQPPFIAVLMSYLWVLAEVAHVPFRVLLRAPVALLDVGTALLLLRAFRDTPKRWPVVAAYWLHPLAVILSAHHGNTDPAVGFFMLLAVVAAGEGRIALAAAALGVGTWVKLPVTLALPAIFFATPGWRARVRFVAVFAAVGASTYLPMLFAAPGLLVERVFAYGGASIETRGGLPIWGLWNLFGLKDALPEGSLLRRVAAAQAGANALVCWSAVLGYAWLRRREGGVRGLGTSVCGCLALFYALTTNLAFQWLAWSVPFWFFPGAALPLVTSAVLGAYVYGVYATVCDSALLLGPWDFRGHAHWPAALVALRDLSLLSCAITAAVFLVSALKRQVRRAARGEGQGG